MRQIPKYQDQMYLLRGKHRIQNKVEPIGISEYQKSLEDLMQAHLYVDL